MALVKCQECATEFSDQAAACPKCACPTKPSFQKHTKLIAILIAVSFVIVLALVVAFNRQVNSSIPESNIVKGQCHLSLTNNNVWYAREMPITLIQAKDKNLVAAIEKQKRVFKEKLQKMAELKEIKETNDAEHKITDFDMRTMIIRLKYELSEDFDALNKLCNKEGLAKTTIMTDVNGGFNFARVDGEGVIFFITKFGEQQMIWLEHIDSATREILLNQYNCLIY